jgi:hypothetical protein
MIFKSDASIDGKLVHGYEDGWHYATGKGHYHTGQDFLWVHWEISDRAPATVKLHVEAPKFAVDPDLNEIKGQLVAAFLDPRIRSAIEQKGLVYKPGSRCKPEHIKKFKCTAPFHIILTKEQIRATHPENIAVVHEVLGGFVEESIRQIREPALDALLSR